MIKNGEYSFFEGKHPVKGKPSRINVKEFLLNERRANFSTDTANYLMSLSLEEVMRLVRSNSLKPESILPENGKYQRSFSAKGHWDPRYWYLDNQHQYNIISTASDNTTYLRESKKSLVDRRFATALQNFADLDLAWFQKQDRMELVEVHQYSRYRPLQLNTYNRESYKVSGRIKTIDMSVRDSFEGRRINTVSGGSTVSLSQVNTTFGLQESPQIDYRLRISGDRNLPVALLRSKDVSYDWPKSEFRVFVALKTDLLNPDVTKIRVYLVDPHTLFIPTDGSTSVSDPKLEREIKPMKVFGIKVNGRDIESRFLQSQKKVDEAHERREVSFRRAPTPKQNQDLGPLGSCLNAFQRKAIPYVRTKIIGY